MLQPDDFGLSPIATLAHVAESSYAPMHRPFWNRWREAVAGCAPKLEVVTTEDPSDPTVTHQIHSLGSVRLGCVLVLPPKGTLVHAGVITTHGYEVGETLGEAARRWKALAARGVAVMMLRVRGYPGSQLDTGDWIGDPESLGWITRGFPPVLNRPEDALAWSLPMAVADVSCGARALRDWLGSRAIDIAIHDVHTQGRETAPLPIFLHGESFGGGLAVMAAAQTPTSFVRFERIVLGVPTFGDWSWRLADPTRMAFGSGAHLMPLLRSLDVSATDTLALCDTAKHAGKVMAPTLCKLALRDEVVPAPSAASVYNALISDPGRKWRFLVPEGHTEPSLACARRLALFERFMIDFFNPQISPEVTMTTLEQKFYPDA